ISLDELVRDSFEPGEISEVRQPVEHDGLVAGRREPPDEVAAEETGAAGDENAHAATLAKRACALDVVGEGPASFEPPGERMRDPPAADALAVELEPVAEEVEAAPDSPGGVGIPREIVAPIAEERGDIERPLAHQARRVDREPSALRLEDVPAVEILVQEGIVLRRGRRSRKKLHRLVQERLFEGATCPLPGKRQLGSPARRFSCERPEGTNRRRLPEL